MFKLSPAQQEAIGHPSRRLQIIACAGSGKTEVLARRAVRLLLEGHPPESLIIFAYTEKAAVELKERIEVRAMEKEPAFRDLPPVARGMFIGTTHGWALQMLRETGGPYETMDPLPEEQEWAFLQRVARRLGVVDLYAGALSRESHKVAAAPAIEAFLRNVEVVHNENIDPEQFREVSSEFYDVLRRYEQLLEDMRLMPFRFMITHAVRELEPGGMLRGRLAGRLRYLLVDEFQDFNRAQNQLLRHLMDLGAAVTVVGDDDQAIYQWRGGDLSQFIGFPGLYSGVRAVALEKNYRCRPGMVDLAGHLVRGLQERADKALTSARDKTEPGSVEIFIGETADDEAREIALRIQTLKENGHPPGDIAVLYRSVRTSAPPLIRALQELGFSCSVVGKTSLLAQEEMALIARIFVYWAGGTWYPSHDRTPEVVVKETLLDQIRQVAGVDTSRAEQIFSALKRLGGKTKEQGVYDIVALYNEMLRLLGLPGDGEDPALRERRLGRMSDLLVDFHHAVRRAMPEKYYQSDNPAARDEIREDRAVTETEPGEEPAGEKQVLEATYGEIYLMRLKAFLEAFAGRAAEENPDPASGDQDAVQIMTVHQAKGLQFPVVFVPCLVEGRFPSSRMGTDDIWFLPETLFDRERYQGREDDEARLLYVALTRARELLVISWFTKYTGREAVPSRFLRKHLLSGLDKGVPFGTVQPPVIRRDGEDELLNVDFSGLTLFQECGYRYWLREVCGFQPELAAELGFGRLLHHLVAELARQAGSGKPPVENDVDAILDRAFYLPFAGPIPARKLRSAARRRVRTYVRDHGEELMRARQPEFRFEVPLGNARVRGRIDLLLHADGSDDNRVELIDFKTAENRPPSEFHRNQLRLYASAAERMGLTPVRLAIHDLDAKNGVRSEISFDDDERRAFEDRLREWVSRIRAGEFRPVEDVKVCEACDFRKFCRHRPERR